jgi:hypothetical protein
MSHTYRIDPNEPGSQAFVATTLPSAGILRRPPKMHPVRRLWLRTKRLVSFRLSQLANWLDPEP